MSDRRNHPLYQTWVGMRARCNNTNYKQYKDYGGRGIKVCSRWDDFWKYVQDMGPRPPGYVMDRINNDEGYIPINCRWVSKQESNSNRRRWGNTSKYRGVYWDTQSQKFKAQITFNGKKYTVGRYDNEEEAHKAYINRLRELKEPEA